MNYYKVVIKEIPRILFAHCYSTTRYHLNFTPRERFIEISSIEQGDVIRTLNSEELLIPAPSFCISLYKNEFSAKSNAPLHQHTTVGIAVDYELLPITKEQVLMSYRLDINDDTSTQSNCVTAILSDYGRINQHNSNIEKLIKQIALTYRSSPPTTRDISCMGLVFDLLLKITEDCIRNVIPDYNDALPPSGLLYVKRAMQFISEHLDKKITIEEIANNLEISCGYLSNLFKSVTGQTLIEYINKLKIAKVKELILTKNASLKQAAESVGIFDENYLSRIFKKYTGLTVKEFKMLQVKK